MEYSKLSYPDMLIKSSYDTIQDDLLVDFYIPVLEHAKRYDRISGFFSSTSLAIAARGIAGLIRNKGKMRLLILQLMIRLQTKILLIFYRHMAQGLLSSSLVMKYMEWEPIKHEMHCNLNTNIA